MEDFVKFGHAVLADRQTDWLQCFALLLRAR